MKKLLLALSLPVFTAQAASPERSVTVSGQCTREILPDRSSITLTAEFRDKEAVVASKKATDTFERVRKLIREKPPENLELETTDFSLNEDFSWNNNQRSSKGFVARASLRVVSSDFGFSSKVIAIAVKEGIRDISGLSSHVSDELSKKTRTECLQDALLDARAKAEKLASAAKSRLGQALLIREDTASVDPGPRFERTMMMAKGGAEAAMDAGPTMERAKTRVSVGLTVSFELQ